MWIVGRDKMQRARGVPHDESPVGMKRFAASEVFLKLRRVDTGMIRDRCRLRYVNVMHNARYVIIVDGLPSHEGACARLNRSSTDTSFAQKQ